MPQKSYLLVQKAWRDSEGNSINFGQCMHFVQFLMAFWLARNSFLLPTTNLGCKDAQWNCKYGNLTMQCFFTRELAANAARIQNTPSKQNCHFQVLSFSSTSGNYLHSTQTGKNQISTMYTLKIQFQNYIQQNI